MNEQRELWGGHSVGVGFLALMAALFFVYRLIEVGVYATYHPIHDYFYAFAFAGFPAFFFTLLFLAICLSNILRRCGVKWRSRTYLCIVIGCCVTLIGYCLATKEPWPEHFEWEFDGEIYEVKWEHARLGLNTQYGTKRSKVNGLSYPACLEPVSLDPETNINCQSWGEFKVKIANPESESTERAFEVFLMMKKAPAGQDMPAVSSRYGLELSQGFEAYRERQRAREREKAMGIKKAIARCEAAQQNFEQIKETGEWPSSSSTSSGGGNCQNRGTILSSSSSTSSSSSSGQFGEVDSSTQYSDPWDEVTSGPVTPIHNTNGVIGYSQSNLKGAPNEYYFWPKTSEVGGLTHWAICWSQPSNPKERKCTHYETIKKRVYMYDIAYENRNDWMAVRNQLIKELNAKKVGQS